MIFASEIDSELKPDNKIISYFSMSKIKSKNVFKKLSQSSLVFMLAFWCGSVGW